MSTFARTLPKALPILLALAACDAGGAGSKEACDGGACANGDGDGDRPGGDGDGPGGDGDGTEPGDGAGSGDADDGVCADVTVRATAATPNVVLIIDQSGSMTESFGSGNRWDVLKSALLSDEGLIAELESVVKFGVALYSYDEQRDATCPVVSPAALTVSLNALADIKRVYEPAQPSDNTPTGESVEAVLAEVQRIGLLGPDVTDPTIFVLATDGNPDTCELPDQGAFGSANSQVATAKSVAAVKAAKAAGVRTYVIAVADEEDLAQSHVNDLANAGVGDPAGPGVRSAPSYRVNDDEGLREALRTIVGGELSCEVRLEGKVVGDACDGTVTLGNETLPCDDPNGWTLLDESTIEVKGTACDALKTGARLSAKFPCGTVVVL